MKIRQMMINVIMNKMMMMMINWVIWVCCSNDHLAPPGGYKSYSSAMIELV